MHAQIVGTTYLDFNTFVKSVGQVIATANPARALDNKGVSFDNFNSQLLLIEAGLNCRDTALVVNNSLNHTLVNLLLICEPEVMLEVLTLNKSLVVSGFCGRQDFYLMSALVSDLRSMVINCCVTGVAKETRMLANLILLIFERDLKISHIFSDYKRVKTDQDSFILVRKQ